MTRAREILRLRHGNGWNIAEDLSLMLIYGGRRLWWFLEVKTIFGEIYRISVKRETARDLLYKKVELNFYNKQEENP